MLNRRWNPSSVVCPARLGRIGSLTALTSAASLVSVIMLGCGARQLKTIDPPDPEVEKKGRVMAVDPMGELPHPTDLASPVEAVVTLRAPVATEAITAMVRRVFESFHSRALSPIELDLEETIIDLASPNETPQVKYTWTYNFTTRIKGSPFDQLDVEQMYRPQDIEIYARDELGLAGRPARPKAMDGDDILVRIPIATTRVGTDVLFGDEIKLLLRRDGNKYRIRGYGEIVPR